MKITQEELPIMAKAYDLVSHSFILIDRSLRIVWMNHSVQKLIGLNNDFSWKGIPFHQLWDSLNLPPLIDAHANLICPKIMVIHNSYRAWQKIRVTLDKKTHWLLLDKDISEMDETYTILENEIAKITGHVFQHHLPVNQYVDEIRHFLTNMINRIPCYMYWKNKELEYIGCNELAAGFFSLASPDDIIGKTDHDLFSDPLLAESYREVDKQILEEGKSILKLPQILVHHNGETFHTLVSKVPITSEDGTIVGILGITIDVTKEKQAEIAKTEFIANMSHDIRTPLTGVIGLSELLENDLTNPIHKEEAHLLYESGNQLLSMLNGILDDVRAGSALESGVDEQSFLLRECFEDLVKLEAPTVAAKNLSLGYTIAPDVPEWIVSDRKKIQHILLNLLGNAVKFTEQGGITLAVTLLSRSNDEVVLHFSVTDTGIGIPEDKKEKVFERFFRVSPSYEGKYVGYGLGLHIVQSYVSLLKGQLHLESKEGVGTTISFDITCREGVTQKQTDENQRISLLERQELKPSTPLSGVPEVDEAAPHFLLVEDNKIALNVLQAFVRKQGARYSSAEHAAQALNYVKTTSFDLIITDIGLPDVSGIQLTRDIRSWEKELQRSYTPIVGLTGHTLESAQSECLEAGMNAVYQKPISQTMLQEIIKKWVRQDQKELKVEPVSMSPPPSLLGHDLPATEDALFVLDSFALFDPQDAMKYMGEESLLFQILKQFLSPEIQNDIILLQDAYQGENWDEVEKLAHKIKGGVACIGTKRLFLACQYLERYYKAGHRSLLNPLYTQIIAVNQQTKEEVSRWLDKYGKH
ncbi:ATP-binding protein [Legionella worsleiensis]|uniref:histidine kinase n=1 Tax=Legionella worsleiensis TaxID=45076 RepID=A0A0W1ALE6_9GAMM|nr:ATP-binding protein [Legionella worsleiensis]KTD81987.1 sensory box histidine kinase/response regulator [Legionella worsleiensis]STY30385.1 sensory box histidine kinase/response regulator [Legionella worsleiensis]